MRAILAALLVLVSTPAFALDCTTLWRNGFPDPSRTGATVPCQSFLPTLTRLPSQIRMYLSDEIASDVAVKQQMEWAAEAVTYSYGKYRALGSLKPVRVVRYDRPYFNAGSGDATPAYTFVRFHQGTEGCPIFLYPDSALLSKDHFYQLVAHELFHCYQQDNYPRQVEVAVLHGEGTWWFEGLAQFFSNVVYPRNDFEYSPFFGTFDPLLPFFEQASPYRSEHFFQSYFHFMASSERTMLNVMSRMPTSAGTSSAQSAMSILRMSEALHQSARELAETKLKDSSGSMAALHAEKTSTVVPSVPRFVHTLNFMDFEISPQQFTLPRGGQYRISARRPDGVKISFKKAEDLEYGELPSTVTTSCDEDRKFDLIATRASADLAMNSLPLIFERDENPECGCDAGKPPADECLYGVWDLDHASVAQFFERLMPPEMFSFRGSEGGFRVEFLRTGELVWSLDNWITRTEIRMPQGTAFAVSTSNGKTQSQYSTAEGGRICSRQTSSTVVSERKVTLNGKTERQQDRPAVDFGAREFTYACDGKSLLYKDGPSGESGGETMKFDFQFTKVR